MDESYRAEGYFETNHEALAAVCDQADRLVYAREDDHLHFRGYDNAPPFNTVQIIKGLPGYDEVLNRLSGEAPEASDTAVYEYQQRYAGMLINLMANDMQAMQYELKTHYIYSPVLSLDGQAIGIGVVQGQAHWRRSLHDAGGGTKLQIIKTSLHNATLYTIAERYHLAWHASQGTVRQVKLLAIDGVFTGAEQYVEDEMFSQELFSQPTADELQAIKTQLEALQP